ncbi:hypothetical protein ACJJID_06275 [Microbulbifer sp. CnH-101-G]|uniref:hypothetical protein n=1 Tax=Microbulbifer sp. CnH-101-G TaxID=3243393 RepID=UPI004039232D
MMNPGIAIYLGFYMPVSDNKGSRGVSISLKNLLFFLTLGFSCGSSGFQLEYSSSGYYWQSGNANIKELHLTESCSPFKMIAATPHNQYASSELLGIVIFRTIAKDVSTSQRVKTPPIRHFDAVTEIDFKPNLARKRYHRICDRKAPQSLNSCAEAQWQYRQAKACLEAREDWEVKWGTSETAEPHERALENVRARVKNAERDRRRYCELEKNSKD